MRELRDCSDQETKLLVGIVALATQLPDDVALPGLASLATQLPDDLIDYTRALGELSRRYFYRDSAHRKRGDHNPCPGSLAQARIVSRAS